MNEIPVFSLPAFELSDYQNRVFLFALVSDQQLINLIIDQADKNQIDRPNAFTPPCYRLIRKNSEQNDREYLQNPEADLLSKKDPFHFDFHSSDVFKYFLETYGVSFSVNEDKTAALVCFLLYEIDEDDSDEIRTSYFSSFAYRTEGEQPKALKLSAQIETWEPVSEDDWDLISRDYKASFVFPFSNQTINDLLQAIDRVVLIENVSDYLDEIYEIYGYLYTTYLVEIEKEIGRMSPQDPGFKIGYSGNLSQYQTEIAKIDEQARQKFREMKGKTREDVQYYKECLSNAVSIYSKTCFCYTNKINAPDFNVPARRSQTLFFRGDSLPYYNLLPSVFRNLKFIKNENKMINDFCAKNDDSFLSKSHFQQLSIMQHHALPTRLLDVSRNPLVALYMSCRNRTDRNQIGEVSIFAPSFLSYESQCPSCDNDITEILSALAFLEYEDKAAINMVVRNAFTKSQQSAIFDFIEDAKTEADMNASFRDKKLPWAPFRESWKKFANLIKEKIPAFDGRVPFELLTSCVFASAPAIDPRVQAQSGYFILCGFDFPKSSRLIFQSKQTNRLPRLLIKNKQEILRQLHCSIFRRQLCFQMPIILQPKFPLNMAMAFSSTLLDRSESS